MSRRKKAAKPDPSAITVEQDEDQEVAEDLAYAVLRPSFQAILSLREYTSEFGDVSLEGMIKGLQEQIDATERGDLGCGEAMLTAQAHTLDAIFNNLARKAITAEYMKSVDINLKLALRAQSQCRATWEAISAIKNPPMVGYVGQANIANGPQQVNNDTAAPRTREDEKSQNELLERNDGERLDTGAAGSAGATDPDLEAVEKIDRTKNR